MVKSNDNSRRIAKNTVSLYARSLFSLFVSLYSSRLILQALGVDDYGTYNVVGGFVSMFWLVSGSLSTAVTRFMNYEMGRGAQERTKMVFSLSLNIMLVLGLVVLLLTETFGLWYLRNRMIIPPGRETAAFWVFQFSIITVISGFALVPFNSTIIAHEKMTVYAYLGIAEAIFRLVIALVLAFGHIRFDRLILYALLWLLATLLQQAVTVLYCHHAFPECRLRRIFDSHLFKEMFSFAGWNFLVSISNTFSGQGVNQVLNLFYGTVVNASRGLAGTVNNVISIFVNNFTLALNPQITQSYAAGEEEYLKSLVFRGTKFSFYLMLLFAVPLFLETPFVIWLWLGQIPEYTVSFIRLTLIISLVDLHGGIFLKAQKATGIIRNLQIWLSLLILSAFPASYIALKFGAEPIIVYVINLIISALNVIVILAVVIRHLPFSLKEIFRNVFLRMDGVAILALPLPFLCHFLLPVGWLRLILVVLISIVGSSLLILFLGCTLSERKIIINSAKKYLYFIKV